MIWLCWRPRGLWVVPGIRSAEHCSKDTEVCVSLQGVETREEPPLFQWQGSRQHAAHRWQQNMKYISATSCRLHLRFCSALIFDPKISSLKRNSCSRELALCACRQSRWHELSMQLLLLCTLLIHSSTLLYYPFSTISNTSSTKSTPLANTTYR